MLPILIPDGVILGLVPHVLREDLDEWFFAGVGCAYEEDRGVGEEGYLADVAEFVGLVIVYTDNVGFGDHDLFVEFVAFLVVHLGYQVASKEVGYDAFLGDLETALGAKAVYWLDLEPTTRINNAIGQFFSTVRVSSVSLIDELLQF